MLNTNQKIVTPENLQKVREAIDKVGVRAQPGNCKLRMLFGIMPKGEPYQ